MEKKNTFFLQNPSLPQNLLKLKMCKLSFKVQTKNKNKEKKVQTFQATILLPPKKHKNCNNTHFDKKNV